MTKTNSYSNNNTNNPLEMTSRMIPKDDDDNNNNKDHHRYHYPNHKNYSSISFSEEFSSSSSSSLSPPFSTSNKKKKHNGAAGTTIAMLVSSSFIYCWKSFKKAFFGTISHKKQRSILSILLITLGISLISCLLLQRKAMKFNKYNNNKENFHLIPPSRTTPTLLSVVNPQTNFYLYAPTNELYQIFYKSTILTKGTNGRETIVVDEKNNDNNNNLLLPRLWLDKKEIKIYDSITLFWTLGQTTTTTAAATATVLETEKGKVMLQDLDRNSILALYCASDNANLEDNVSHDKFLEAATIEQARATSVKHGGKNNNNNNNQWYIPKFPNIRQEYCQFRLFFNQTSSTPNIATTNDSSSIVKEEGQGNDNEHPQQQQRLVYITSSETFSIVDAKSAPTQLHLALSDDPTKMVIHFTTGYIPNTIPVVRCMKKKMEINDDNDIDNNHDNDNNKVYSISRNTESNNNNDDSFLWFHGDSDTYTPDDLCGAPANDETIAGRFYPPGMLHVVELDNLEPDTVYTYQVGLLLLQQQQQPQNASSTTTTIMMEDLDDIHDELMVLNWSDAHSFTTAPPPLPVVSDDTNNREISFIVYGDQGCPYQGWQVGYDWLYAMMQREKNASMIHHFGDLSYAVGAAHVWDGWLDMIQPFAPSIPLMVAVGNHEYDHLTGGENGKDPSGVETPHGFMPEWGNYGHDSYGECGVPTSKRFRMPSSSTTTAISNGVYWYSFPYGSVYTIVLSSEHDLSPGSAQYNFLEATLQNNIDRTITPWVIVELHRPMYEAEGGGHEADGNTKVAEAIRNQIEDLLRDYQVDLVLAGHYHEYFRTCDGVYKGQCDVSGSPMHITVGSAGASLDTDIELDVPWSFKNIRDEFGYGRITIANSTDLHFEFVLHGDLDDPMGGQVHDDFWIHRDR